MSVLVEWLNEQARVRGLGSGFASDEDMETEMLNDSEMLLKAADRIAALEAGLRQYADIRNWRIENDGYHYPLIVWIGPGATSGGGGIEIADAVLAENQ